jgi:gas vesicle protein
MDDRRLGEDITAGHGDYLTQKEQQYSRELSEVRSHLEERVKEVKTDLEKDIREVKTDLKDDLKEVKEDLKDDLKGIKNQVMALMALGITSLVALIGIIVTLRTYAIFP